ncbi:PEP-CTERM sorting domain-containing protein [Geminocystis sp.]|uniref:PEP-CTERM sorting domain-containing protein n=1 Tax=Geminocystis sp. TaxID=2664100 RepID=UPI00359358AE
MSNQSFFKNKLAVGVMTLGLATTASLLAPNSAEALNLKFELTGANFAGGGTLTGSFLYDTTTNVYSNWNFISTASALSSATGGLANPFNYTPTSAPSFGTLTGTAFQIRTGVSPNDRRILNLLFSTSLATFDTIGQSTTLIPFDEDISFGSSDRYIQSGVTQIAGLTGGTVTVVPNYDVPEPLTILGTLVAGGIGVGMKRKKQQLQKETV